LIRISYCSRSIAKEGTAPDRRFLPLSSRRSGTGISAGTRTERVSKQALAHRCPVAGVMARPGTGRAASIRGCVKRYYGGTYDCSAGLVIHCRHHVRMFVSCGPDVFNAWTLYDPAS
jgi:hypothetical protein